MGAKRRLDLAWNKIDDLDAYTIGMCLSKKDSTLEIVHLGTNSLTDEGLKIILMGLQTHVKLRELYLGNYILFCLSFGSNIFFGTIFGGVN